MDKILARASQKMPPDEALKFLKTVPFFNDIPVKERENFCERGEIMDTPSGERLAQFIAKKGAEAALVEKYRNQRN